jgi:hypothetical protein
MLRTCLIFVALLFAAVPSSANTGPGKPVSSGRRVLILYNADDPGSADVVNGFWGLKNLLTSAGPYTANGFNFTTELVSVSAASYNNGQGLAAYNAGASASALASRALNASNYCIVFDLRFRSDNAYPPSSPLAVLGDVRGDTIVNADVAAYSAYLASGGGLYIMGDNYYGGGGPDGFISRMETLYRFFNAVAATGVGPDSNGFGVYSGGGGASTGRADGSNPYSLESDYNNLAGLSFTTTYPGIIDRTRIGSAQVWQKDNSNPSNYALALAWQGAALQPAYSAGRLIYHGDESAHQLWANGVAGSANFTQFIQNAVDFLYNDNCCSVPGPLVCGSASDIAESPDHPVVSCFSGGLEGWAGGDGFTAVWDGTQNASGTGGSVSFSDGAVWTGKSALTLTFPAGSLNGYDQLCFSMRITTSQSVSFELWDQNWMGTITSPTSFTLNNGGAWQSFCLTLAAGGGNPATATQLTFRLTGPTNGFASTGFWLDDLRLHVSCGNYYLRDASCCALSTPTFSPTATPMATRTASPGATPSASPSRTPSASASASPSATPSSSPSASPTPTPSFTPSRSATGTASLTESPSPTPSASATQTASPTRTMTATPSLSPSATPSLTASASATFSGTPSPSASASATLSWTPSPTPSASPSASPSATGSLTATLSPSATASPSPSPSFSPSATATDSATVSVTASPSPSASSSPTLSASASASPSATLSQTHSATATPSATPSPTESWTASVTATPSPSASPTPSATASASATPSRTASATATPSRSSSPTRTISPTGTPSPIPAPLRAVIGVYNSAGERVRLLYDGGLEGAPSPSLDAAVLAAGGSLSLRLGTRLPGGASSLSWDGTSDGGQSVAGGVYELKVETEDPFGAKTSVILSVQALSAPLGAVLAVYNSAGECVRRQALSGPDALASGFEPERSVLAPEQVLKGQLLLPGGPVISVLWDGRNAAGDQVAGGVYSLVLELAGTGRVVQARNIEVLKAPGPPAPELVAGPSPLRGRWLTLVCAPFAGRSLAAQAYDLAGEAVAAGASSDGSGRLRLDAAGLAPGLYFLAVQVSDPGLRYPPRVLRFAVLH